MITRRDVFQAIADPVRRDIILKITAEPLTLNSVAENFSISRQAVSKHMQILTECGLVQVTKNGRERICQIKMEKLEEVSNWITLSKKLWANRFEKLDHYLTEIKNQAL